MDMHRINHFSKLHLNQINHLKKQLEAREYLEKNIALRNKWVNNQNKLAYRQELDNIRRAMESSISNRTKDQLRQRAGDMKKLLSS